MILWGLRLQHREGSSEDRKTLNGIRSDTHTLAVIGYWLPLSHTDTHTLTQTHTHSHTHSHTHTHYRNRLQYTNRLSLYKNSFLPAQVLAVPLRSELTLTPGTEKQFSE
ncbi:hypothetical protein OYC64_001099 [Pagothenia borchgrevinki]|uniref:Uncharacterized protein n=1 Tax=Pagothenia borchgrevinki TaxID=8213 RepID=A0ABD2HGT4_PAGBO